MTRATRLTWIRWSGSPSRRRKSINNSVAWSLSALQGDRASDWHDRFIDISATLPRGCLSAVCETNKGGPLDAIEFSVVAASGARDAARPFAVVCHGSDCRAIGSTPRLRRSPPPRTHRPTEWRSASHAKRWPGCETREALAAPATTAAGIPQQQLGSRLSAWARSR